LQQFEQMLLLARGTIIHNGTPPTYCLYHENDERNGDTSNVAITMGLVTGAGVCASNHHQWGRRLSQEVKTPGSAIAIATR